MKKLKLLTCLLLSLNMVSAYSAARTGNEGGGGDASEVRINEIRTDLLQWISNGGAKDLALPANISYEDYVTRMNEILQPQEVIIGFIDQDDNINEELQVSVKGVPKTCRGFISKSDRAHIICNIARFKNTSEAEQYKLIHHEYAGLARIEKNMGAASDYNISSQITDFLVPETVLKLAVKSAHERRSLGLGRCQKIYIAFSEKSSRRKELEKAALDLKERLLNENENLSIEFLNTYFIPHLKNENESVEVNSTIIELNFAVDLSSSSLRVSAYQKDAKGKISFIGGEYATKRFYQAKTLSDLGRNAFSYACGSF